MLCSGCIAGNEAAWLPATVVEYTPNSRRAVFTVVAVNGAQVLRGRPQLVRISRADHQRAVATFQSFLDRQERALASRLKVGPKAAGCCCVAACVAACVGGVGG